MMKLRLSGRALALVCCVLLGASACVAPKPKRAEVATGSRAEVTEDGLHRMLNAGFAEAWAKPDANLAGYDKVALQFVKIRYKRKPTSRRYTGASRSNFAFTQSQVQRVTQAFRDIFEAELGASKRFELVEEPGPDVLYVEASIVDLIVKVPTESYAGREATVTTSTADMTLMLELYDSQSGELLARVKDRKEARQAGHSGVNDLYSSNVVTNSEAVRRLFRRWARILRERLDLLPAAAGAALEAPDAPATEG
jgi:hypothetical protein